MRILSGIGTFFVVALCLIIGFFLVSWNEATVFLFNITPDPVTVLSTIECSSGLQVKISSQEMLSEPSPETGARSTLTCVSFALYEDGSLLFDTGLANECDGSLDTAKEFAYHSARQQASLIENKGIANATSQCLASNSTPTTDGVENISAKTIPLPTTASFVTLFSGQSAVGAINGMHVVLSLDATTSQNAIGGYSYMARLYVNGAEPNSWTVGNVKIQPWSVFADGSETFDISYPDASGQYHVP